MSRADLAGAVRDGRVSPRQLVEECLRRIEAANTNLNAVVSLRADAALAEADTHPRTGPLAGLPLLVKDLARTVGLPTTFGSHLYAEAPPDDVDDLFVAKLKRAGAIVVGKTNTPAFGHTGFTDNQVFGPTRNPWNLSRSPGGSSGGAGAALAAGLAPLATSSDGGGSVRIPAALCGLVGYKATNGAIGRGTLPRWLEFSSMGCTASTVADVLLEASVVMGAAPGDVISIPAEGVDIEPRLPSHLVACPTLRMGADDVIASAFSAAVDALGSEIGVDVVHVEGATSRECSKRWFTMATAELAQSLLEHRDRWTEFEPTLRQAVEIGIEVPMTEYVAAARERWAECARVDTLLGVDGVLLTPTVNSCAWVPEGPMPNKAGGVDDTWIALNTADFNFTGHPAINVPLGYDAVGVPFGLQIVAPRCRDGLAFGVAQVWERLQPWPEVAPGYQPFGID